MFANDVNCKKNQLLLSDCVKNFVVTNDFDLNR